jgi:hypothetical protein
LTWEQIDDLPGGDGRPPLKDLVTKYGNPFTPSNAYISGQIVNSNQDCVLAAFRTVQRGVPARESEFNGVETSTSEAIERVASAYGMERVTAADLPRILPTVRFGAFPPEGAPRVFITAPALLGKGRHAYAAIGIDANSGKIIAWDPDNEHQNLKAVPMSLVRQAFATRKR